VNAAPELRCLCCRETLNVAVDYNGEVMCACGQVLPVIRGVPLFLVEGGHDVSSNPAVRALAESTFRYPRRYEAMIKAKVALQGAVGSRDAMLGIAEYVSGASVLDVGCGPNLSLPNAENAHEQAALYFGVDVSAPFAIAARDRHPGRTYRFAQADARNLPFADNSFDTVLASFTIHHVPGDASAVFAEMRRVARSHVVIYDHVRSVRRSQRALQDFYWRRFDGGTNYLTWREWEDALYGHEISRVRRSGILFNHVVKMAVRIPSARPTERSA